MEVKGQAGRVATDRTGSITLQRLLPLCSPDRVGEVMAEVGGASGSEFKAVCCDRCGGHVVESALRQMSRWTGETRPPCAASLKADLQNKSLFFPAETPQEEEEEEGPGVLEGQVLCLGQVVRENIAEFIAHAHGSHVVRTLLHVLTGCLGPARSETRPGKHFELIFMDLTGRNSLILAAP